MKIRKIVRKKEKESKEEKVRERDQHCEKEMREEGEMKHWSEQVKKLVSLEKFCGQLNQPQFLEKIEKNNKSKKNK